MSFEEDLVSYLTASGSLTALVGTRIAPSIQDGETVPFIKYEVENDRDHYYSGGKADAQSVNFTLTVHGSSKASAKAVCDVLRTLLSGYTGSFGDGLCRACFKELDSDLETAAVGGETIALIRRMLSFTMVYYP